MAVDERSELEELRELERLEAKSVGEVASARRTPMQMMVETEDPILGGMGALSQGVGSVLSGVPAAAIGGLSGIAGAALPGPPGQGARWAETVGGQLQYQPRTEGGRTVANVLGWPFEKLAELGRYTGGAVLERTESPTLATLSDVAINALPMLLGRGRGAGEAPRATPEVAEPTRRVTPQEAASLERAERAENLPVPVPLTKGQMTRDPGQLRVEENLAQIEPGRAIRERHIQQNQALIDSLDILKERAGPKSVSLEDIGRRVAGEKEKGEKRAVVGAISMQEQQSLARVSELYKRADASPEKNMPVTPQPMIDWLTDNGAAAASVPEINSIAQMLKKFGAVSSDAQGRAVAARNLTVGEMEEIRKLATKLQQPGKPAGYYMGDLKNRIDWTLQDAGGDLYKAARKARFEHAMKFEEPRAIATLLKESSRTDRAVALENIWGNVVMRGSLADLERVRNNLLQAPDRMTRDAGRKAWRDIVSQTVEHIKGEATKSAALDSAGNPNLSPAALKRAIDRIGDKKLNLILGKSSADQLRNIAAVASDIKTMPPYKGGSTTMPNYMAMMERVLGHVPLVGPITRGAIGLGRQAHKYGLAEKQAAEALQPFARRVPAVASRPGIRLSELPWELAPSIGLRRSEQEQ